MKPAGAIVGFVLVLLGAGCTSFRTTHVRSEGGPDGTDTVAVSADDGVFDEDLAPYGTWIVVQDYGRVWSPYGIPIGWRPYTYGHWEYTTLGLTWVSSWPWGWCCFHYGRWWLSPVSGWVWIPGRTWGPAWVAWRSDPDWFGWAPLPPEAVWVPRVGFRRAPISFEDRIGPSWWCFVHRRDLMADRLEDRIAGIPESATLLERTHWQTRYEEREGRPALRSLEPDEIARSTGRPVEVRRTVEVRSPDELRRPRASEGPVAVFRPDLERRTKRPEGEVPSRPRQERPAQPQAPPLEPPRVQPGVQPPSRPDTVRRRQEAERQSLVEQQERLRRELATRQMLERNRTLARVPRSVLEQRQEVQRRAAEREYQRQSRSLQFWQERELQQRPSPQPAPRKFTLPTRPAGQPPGIRKVPSRPQGMSRGREP